MSVRIGNKIVAGMPEKAMRGVGDIFTTTDRGVIAGAVEANGGSYNIADYNSGTESLAVKLASGRLPYVSKTEFATQVANTGACGSFGWNGAGGDVIYAWERNYTYVYTKGLTLDEYAPVYNADGTVYGRVVDAIVEGDTELTVEVQSGDVWITDGTYVRYGDGDTRVSPDTTFLVPKLPMRTIVKKQKPTAANNYTWYNLYSDGWVEQGGYIPASTATTQINNLIVPMVDANYAIDITAEASTWTGGNNSVFNRTTTGFQLWTSDDSSFNSVPVIWQVSGYASSTAVTPERTMVQLATGATDEALVTCTEVLSDVAALKLTGQIITYAGTTAPSGYLACDGSAVSRTTYANLFAVIGTAYGEGDGSTTFNIPNRKEVIGRNLDYSNSTKIGDGNQTFTMPFDGIVIRTATIGKGNGVWISINGTTVVTNRPYQFQDLVNGGVVFAIAQAGDTVVANADYGSTGTTVVIPYVEKTGGSMFIKY